MAGKHPQFLPVQGHSHLLGNQDASGGGDRQPGPGPSWRVWGSRRGSSKDQSSNQRVLEGSDSSTTLTRSESGFIRIMRTMSGSQVVPRNPLPVVQVVLKSPDDGSQVSSQLGPDIEREGDRADVPWQPAQQVGVDGNSSSVPRSPASFSSHLTKDCFPPSSPITRSYPSRGRHCLNLRTYLLPFRYVSTSEKPPLPHSIGSFDLQNGWHSRSIPEELITAQTDSMSWSSVLEKVAHLWDLNSWYVP